MSHDLERAASLTDDALVLDRGRLVDRGRPSDVTYLGRRMTPMTTGQRPRQHPDLAGGSCLRIVGAHRRRHLVAANDWGSAARSVVAAVRAFVQLAAVGALLLIVFDRGGRLAAFAWLAVMVVIAGFVAGRRAASIPQARQHAWWGIGVAVGATMGVLLVLGVIASDPAVVIPVGGMVVSTAMVTAGLALQRTVDVVTTSAHSIEARLALGLSGS